MSYRTAARRPAGVQPGDHLGVPPPAAPSNRSSATGPDPQTPVQRQPANPWLRELQEVVASINQLGLWNASGTCCNSGSRSPSLASTTLSRPTRSSNPGRHRWQHLSAAFLLHPGSIRPTAACYQRPPTTDSSPDEIRGLLNNWLTHTVEGLQLPLSLRPPRLDAVCPVLTSARGKTLDWRWDLAIFPWPRETTDRTPVPGD